MYRVSKKVTPQDFCIYFCLWLSSTDENFLSCLPFIWISLTYQFWSTNLSICENCCFTV